MKEPEQKRAEQKLAEFRAGVRAIGQRLGLSAREVIEQCVATAREVAAEGPKVDDPVIAAIKGRAKWVERAKGDTRTIFEFIDAVYPPEERERLGMTQAHLLHPDVDESAYLALYNWRKPRPDGFYLPTKQSKNDSLLKQRSAGRQPLARLISVPMELLSVEERQQSRLAAVAAMRRARAER